MQRVCSRQVFGFCATMVSCRLCSGFLVSFFCACFGASSMAFHIGVWLWLCSTSFPGGHQVDGLPPASSVWQIDLRTRISLSVSVTFARRSNVAEIIVISCRMQRDMTAHRLYRKLNRNIAPPWCEALSSRGQTSKSVPPSRILPP